jgi:outer membrane protein OmpA-like peptidoglycan-associated protein
LDPNTRQSSLDFHFDFQRADLPEKCDGKVTMLVAFLKDNPGTSVTLSGYLDQREAQDHSAALREERARAVREVLVANGIDPKRIRMTSGTGSKLVCSDQAETCSELNRRVEVQIQQSGS